MKAPKAYFFDLDGTLTDSSEGLYFSFRAALRALKLDDISDERLERFLGTPLPEMFRVLKPMISKQEIVAGMDAFRVAYEGGGIQKNRLYPGVEAMLAAIARKHCLAWIVTSKPQHYANQVAKTLGIDRVVNGITGAGLDESDTKGELVAKALHEAGMVAADTLMLGDRFYDIAGARENDVLPVGALWGYGSYEELHSAGCREFVATASEFQSKYVEAAEEILGSIGRA